MLTTFDTALRQAVGNCDVAGLVALVDRLGDADHDKAAAELWTTATELAGHLPFRIVSFLFARRITGTVRDLCVASIMETNPADMETAGNLLNALGTTLDDSALPDFQLLRLYSFLKHCLTHEQLSVKFGGVELLSEMTTTPRSVRRLGKQACNDLANLVVEHVVPHADEDEVDELREVLEALRAESVPEFVTPDLAAITNAVQVCETANIRGLPLKVALRMRLEDTARRKAVETKKPVIVQRDSGSSWSDVVFRHLDHLVELCFQEVSEKGEAWPDWQPGPASSRTRLTAAGKKGAIKAFGELKLLPKFVSDAGAVEQHLLSIRPRQAQLLLDIGDALPNQLEDIEVLLVKPDSREAPESLQLQPSIRFPASAPIPESQLRATLERKREVYSGEVPQANAVLTVLAAVTDTLEHGEPTTETLPGITVQRQVNYYEQGARVLGLFDRNNRPTARTYRWLSLSEADRKKRAAEGFADSDLAKSWCAFAGNTHLADVDPMTAEPFLADRAVGISGDTVGRRASTLRKWHYELMPHHPTHPSQFTPQRPARRPR